MGAFFTNYQVRADSVSDVRNALARLVRSRAYISPPMNGWITVYDEASDEQDDAIIRRVAAGLSDALKTAVLGFLVHDSDIFMYWLYQCGKLLDEFNSAPDYFGKKVRDAERARLRGNTDTLLPLCAPGTSRAQLDAVLHPPGGHQLMAEDILADLAELLGTDRSRAVLGFRYFDEEGEEMLPDIAEFEPVGKSAERKNAKPAAADRDTDVPQVEPFVAAVGFLANGWGARQQISKWWGAQAPAGANLDEMLNTLQIRFDRSAKDAMKIQPDPSRPSYEELKAARDQGPDALAELVVRRAPQQLTNIGVGAAVSNSEPFIVALLARGLDPNSVSSQGLTPLSAAELHHGKNSKMYQLLQSVSDHR